MALFKFLSIPDRKQTQLAYRIKYWPRAELSDTAKDLICWHKMVYMRKREIIAACMPGFETLTYKNKDFKIVWAYNNIPTELEWNGKTDEFLIRVELRCSPAIDDFAVAVLNFELQP